MKTKVGILLAVIILPICYALWKNSTMNEIDFDDLFSQVDEVRVNTPESNFLNPPTPETPLVISQYDVNPDTLEELYDASDVVAIIQPISREQKISVVNTVVEIKKSYKSEYQQGQQISLFEEYHLQFDPYGGDHSAGLYSTGGYIPMDLDKEYLVFLKKSLKYTSDQFGFISLLYGKFPYITKEPKLLEIDSSTTLGMREITLDELNQHDVVLFNMIEDVENPLTEESKNKWEKYEKYKENYMKILEGLIDTAYIIEG